MTAANNIDNLLDLNAGVLRIPNAALCSPGFPGSGLQAFGATLDQFATGFAYPVRAFRIASIDVTCDVVSDVSVPSPGPCNTGFVTHYNASLSAASVITDRLIETPCQPVDDGRYSSLPSAGTALGMYQQGCNVNWSHAAQKYTENSLGIQQHTGMTGFVHRVPTASPGVPVPANFWFWGFNILFDAGVMKCQLAGGSSSPRALVVGPRTVSGSITFQIYQPGFAPETFTLDIE